MDVSRDDVKKIKDKVLAKSKPAAENRKKMDKFRSKKIPETNPFGAMPQVSWQE